MGNTPSTWTNCQLFGQTFGKTWTDAIKFGISGTIGEPNGPQCPTGYTLNGLLCYSNCPQGTSADGGQITTCRQNCPQGYSQGPNTCTGETTSRKIITYRGTGTLPTCAPGETETNGTCYPMCPQESSADWGQVNTCRQNCPPGTTQLSNTCNGNTTRKIVSDRGTGKMPICRPGEININGLCYPQCPVGSSSDWGQVNTCRQDCQTDYTQLSNSCLGNSSTRKVTLNRGAGTSMQCPAGKVNISGLCYTPCPPGSTADWGQINTCRQNCQTDYTQLSNSCVAKTNIRQVVLNRGAGTSMQCPAGKINKAGLCYNA